MFCCCLINVSLYICTNNFLPLIKVRDSVVNQLLAKIDGVKEVPNVLIVGLTNRPELLDPALIRPGRLEVQLRVELPDR